MKVFLDSNVFITAIEKSLSNSRLIINLAMDRKFIIIISKLAIEEVSEYFKRNYSRNAGWLVSKFIEKIPQIEIYNELKFKREIKLNKNKFKLSEEDASHLTVAIERNADYFVSLNRDFLKNPKIKEPKILNPKEFIKKLNLKPITDFE